MPEAPYPYNEEQRLQELLDAEILNSEYEREFDEIVELASRICDTPISLISLIDTDRQWFKAKKGFKERETSRTISFCAHAILQDELFLVKDASLDERFASYETVTGEPNIRFYAGSPIVSPNGYKLGTLCVVDSKPKELSAEQISALKILSYQVSKLIEFRKLRKDNIKAINLLLEKDEQINKLTYFFKRLGRLMNEQAAHLQQTFAEKLTPVKTGKFTKKDLSAIAQGIENKVAQTASFADSMQLLAESLHSERMDWQAFRLSELVKEVEQDVKGRARERNSKLQWMIEEDMELYQSKMHVAFILKTFSHRLLSVTKKAELFITLTKKDNWAECRFSLPAVNIVQELQRYSTDIVQEKTEAISKDEWHFYDLHVLNDILKEMGCRYQISKLGKSGTVLTLRIPDKAASVGIGLNR